MIWFWGSLFVQTIVMWSIYLYLVIIKWWCLQLLDFHWCLVCSSELNLYVDWKILSDIWWVYVGYVIIWQSVMDIIQYIWKNECILRHILVKISVMKLFIINMKKLIIMLWKKKLLSWLLLLFYSKILE